MQPQSRLFYEPYFLYFFIHIQEKIPFFLVSLAPVHLFAFSFVFSPRLGILSPFFSSTCFFFPTKIQSSSVAPFFSLSGALTTYYFSKNRHFVSTVSKPEFFSSVSKQWKRTAGVKRYQFPVLYIKFDYNYLQANLTVFV